MPSFPIWERGGGGSVPNEVEGTPSPPGEAVSPSPSNETKDIAGDGELESPGGNMRYFCDPSTLTSLSAGFRLEARQEEPVVGSWRLLCGAASCGKRSRFSLLG